MLLRELKNKRNKTMDVTIGDPIPYSEMEGIKDKVELINFIENQTMRLKDFPPKPKAVSKPQIDWGKDAYLHRICQTYFPSYRSRLFL